MLTLYRQIVFIQRLTSKVIHTLNNDITIDIDNNVYTQTSKTQGSHVQIYINYIHANFHQENYKKAKYMDI